MSDMHVMAGDGWRYMVIMHIPIPNANNAVGVNYRTALVNSGLGGTTEMTEGSAAGQIATAEVAQIANGEVYEHSEMISVDGAGQSTGGRQAMLRARYTVTKAAVLARLQSQLRFFGHVESEV